MEEWKRPLMAAGAGAISGTAIGLLGFLFVSAGQYPNMGLTLFFLVPAVAGASIAMVARKPDIAAVAAALLSAVCSLLILIAFGKEGPLCAILAFPVIFIGLSIGLAIGMLLRKLLVKHGVNQTTTFGVIILAAPTVIFAGDRMERPVLQDPRTEIVQTSVEVDDTPEHVWSRILSIDSVQASKPFLMYVGLPIPQRCTLQGRGVGAKRTCYFDVGSWSMAVLVYAWPSASEFAILIRPKGWRPSTHGRSEAGRSSGSNNSLYSYAYPCGQRFTVMACMSRAGSKPPADSARPS
jgi:hypothetical protein